MMAGPVPPLPPHHSPLTAHDRNSALNRSIVVSHTVKQADGTGHESSAYGWRGCSVSFCSSPRPTAFTAIAGLLVAPAFASSIGASACPAITRLLAGILADSPMRRRLLLQPLLGAEGRSVPRPQVEAYPHLNGSLASVGFSSSRGSSWPARPYGTRPSAKAANKAKSWTLAHPRSSGLFARLSASGCRRRRGYSYS